MVKPKSGPIDLSESAAGEEDPGAVLDIPPSAAVGLPPGQRAASDDACPRCAGRGTTAQGECPDCQGTGKRLRKGS